MGSCRDHIHGINALGAVAAPKKDQQHQCDRAVWLALFPLGRRVAVGAGDAEIDEVRHAARPRDVDQTTPLPDLAIIASFPEVQRRKHAVNAGKVRMNGR